MGTLNCEFPDFWIFSSNHCIKDIFDTGDLHILTGYRMQEHASLAVWLETQMHLENLVQTAKPPFCKRALLQKFTGHLNGYPTSISNTMPAWQKYLPILGKLALLQHSRSLKQKKGKRELDDKHRFMTCHQKLKT